MHFAKLIVVFIQCKRKGNDLNAMQTVLAKTAAIYL